MKAPEQEKHFKVRRVRVALIFLAFAVLLLFYPFESIVVPAWTIQIVNQQGVPVKGIRVIQFWKHWSLEPDTAHQQYVYPHEQELWTDDNGSVAFPSRTIRASMLYRLLAPVRNISQRGVHASFGPDASIAADGEEGEGLAFYRPNEPLPKEIVLKKWQHGSNRH